MKPYNYSYKSKSRAASYFLVCLLRARTHTHVTYKANFCGPDIENIWIRMKSTTDQGSEHLTVSVEESTVGLTSNVLSPGVAVQFCLRTYFTSTLTEGWIRVGVNKKPFPTRGQVAAVVHRPADPSPSALQEPISTGGVVISSVNCWQSPDLPSRSLDKGGNALVSHQSTCASPQTCTHTHQRLRIQWRKQLDNCRTTRQSCICNYETKTSHLCHGDNSICFRSITFTNKERGFFYPKDHQFKASFLQYDITCSLSLGTKMRGLW